MKITFDNKIIYSLNCKFSGQLSQWAKIRQKYSLKECVFANSALKIQCHNVKNTPLRLLGICTKVSRPFFVDKGRLITELERYTNFQLSMRLLQRFD